MNKVGVFMYFLIGNILFNSLAGLALIEYYDWKTAMILAVGLMSLDVLKLKPELWKFWGTECTKKKLKEDIL